MANIFLNEDEKPEETKKPPTNVGKTEAGNNYTQAYDTTIGKWWHEFISDNPRVNEYATEMGNLNPYYWTATAAGAILIGLGAFKLAKMWKEYRRKRAAEEGVSLSPEVDEV